MSSRFLMVLTTLVGLAFGAVAADDAETKIPCGWFISLRLVEGDALTWDWDVRNFKEQPTLGEGEKFAVVQVKLDENKSIGKRDYKLGTSDCLAMAINPNAFNPGNWEFRDQPDTARIELVFKVRAADDKQGFTFAYKYQDKANVFVKDPNCVNRTISTRGIGAAPSMSGDGGDPTAIPIKKGGAKAGKKKGGDEGEEATGEDEEETPKKKAGKSKKAEPEPEPEEETPAKKKGGDSEPAGGGKANWGI